MEHDQENVSEATENASGTDASQAHSPEEEAAREAREKFFSAFKEYYLENGKRPPYAYQFIRSAGLDEGVFYEQFSSIKVLEQELWLDYLGRTMMVLYQDEVYQNYSVREKLLSFYFTLLEVLKSDRSFVSVALEDINPLRLTPDFLKSFKEEYSAYISGLLMEGGDTEEVAQRPFFSERYAGLHWYQLVFLLTYWSSDESKGFQNSDEAVEKAVNLGFDLMGRNVFDSAVDFGRFLLKRINL